MMQCPLDGTQLVMSERQGIEIDYCPKCRGVWLDRGELDKLIERGGADAMPAPQSYAQPQKLYKHDDDDHRGYKHHENKHGYPHKKKRESLLSELFDF